MHCIHISFNLDFAAYVQIRLMFTLMFLVTCTTCYGLIDHSQVYKLGPWCNCYFVFCIIIAADSFLLLVICRKNVRFMTFGWFLIRYVAVLDMFIIGGTTARCFAVVNRGTGFQHNRTRAGQVNNIQQNSQKSRKRSSYFKWDNLYTLRMAN